MNNCSACYCVCTGYTKSAGFDKAARMEILGKLEPDFVMINNVELKKLRYDAETACLAEEHGMTVSFRDSLPSGHFWLASLSGGRTQESAHKRGEAVRNLAKQLEKNSA